MKSHWKKFERSKKENHQHDFLKISNFHLNEVREKKTSSRSTGQMKNKNDNTQRQAKNKMRAHTHTLRQITVINMLFDIAVHFASSVCVRFFSHHFSLSMALIIAHTDHFCGNNE